MLFVAQVGQAQQDKKPAPPVTPPASSGTTASPHRNENGNRRYDRTTGTTAAAPTPSAATMQTAARNHGQFPVPLCHGRGRVRAACAAPRASGNRQRRGRADPATINAAKTKDAQLEVVDPDHSRVARLPVAHVRRDAAQREQFQVRANRSGSRAGEGQGRADGGDRDAGDGRQVVQKKRHAYERRRGNGQVRQRAAQQSRSP